MLGVDHDKIILLSIPVPLIPILGTNCCCDVIFCSMLEINYVELYCIVLHCIALHCIALHCIALYCIVLYCIVLYCIALHCIVLYCNIKYAIDSHSLSTIGTVCSRLTLSIHKFPNKLRHFLLKCY